MHVTKVIVTSHLKKEGVNRNKKTTLNLGRLRLVVQPLICWTSVGVNTVRNKMIFGMENKHKFTGTMDSKKPNTFPKILQKRSNRAIH